MSARDRGRGRKLTTLLQQLIYLAIILFGAGSIIAAVARNFTVILVGRVIQGIGGGGMMALAEVANPP